MDTVFTGCNFKFKALSSQVASVLVVDRPFQEEFKNSHWRGCCLVTDWPPGSSLVRSPPQRQKAPHGVFSSEKQVSHCCWGHLLHIEPPSVPNNGTAPGPHPPKTSHPTVPLGSSLSFGSLLGPLRGVSSGEATRVHSRCCHGLRFRQ